ncbi:MAG: hypothetical protein AAF922_15190 [Pseudomonadota bacterium]
MKIEYIFITLLGLAALAFFGNTAIGFRDDARDRESRYERAVLDVKAAVAGQ